MSNAGPTLSSRATHVSVAVAIGVVVGLLLGSVTVGATNPSHSAGLPASDFSNLLVAAETSLASGAGPANGVPAVCSPDSPGSAVCSTHTAAVSGPATIPGGQWIGVNYTRAFASLAYDARDGYVLGFGGLHGSGPLGDTWIYAAGNWSLLLTPVAPSPRWGASLTYDGASSSLVLFGGRNSTTYFNDTWVYTGGTWTELTLSTAPSARAFAGMTYDAYAADNYTVLFGGTNATTPAFNDTWEFHNDAWTQLSPTGTPPPALEGGAFAFDNHLGEAVLFGGRGPGGYSSATYAYRSDAWSVGPTGPPALAFAGMVFDRAADVKALVLFGGYDGSSYSGATWELVNETWVAGPSGPTGRDGAPVTFDGLHRDFCLVLWAGYDGSSYLSDTWNLTGSGWTEVGPGGHPGALTGAALVFVPPLDEAVLFGGLSSLGPTNATWIFQGGSWSLLCTGCGPSPRYNAAATYSSALGGALLFGGYSGSALYHNDTWTFVNNSWTNVTSGTTPAPRELAGLSYYANPINESILFGGSNATAYFNDTWEFNGSAWTQVPVTTSPSARSDPTLTFDGPDGYILLFGGENLTSVFNDTWIFRGVTSQGWFQLTPSTHPSARIGAGAAYDPYNGYVVLNGGSNGTSFFNDTWGFIRGNWTAFAPATSPPARANAGYTYDRSDQYIVQFGGSGRAGWLSDTWLWVAFSARVSVSPNPTDVGVAASFGVTAIGGVLPYSYLWSFGDGFTNTSVTPTHTYAAAGTYTANVRITDSNVPAPDGTTSNETVVVNPALAVSASASPSVATPGYPVAFNSTVSGGTPSFTYYWSFGDGTNASTANATHAYATNGTYTATVVVNDSAGASALRSVNVQVVPSLAAIVSAQPTATDVEVPVAFNSTPIGGAAPYSYSWQFGDGTGASVENTTHAYAAAGTYTVHYWVNDSAAHSYTTVLSVGVVPLPTAQVVIQPATVTVGGTVSYHSTISNGTAPYTFLWSFGDGGTASTENASHSYATAGSFPVTFVATDARGENATASSGVTVVSAPSVTASTSPSPSEVGVSVSFSATAAGGSPPIAYAWTFGDGARATGATPSHPYATSGTFAATVWANDSLGQSSSRTVSVRVDPTIAASAQVSPIATDVGLVVSFSGSSSGGVGPVQYAWSFGDGSGATGASTSHAYSSAGTYTVVLWANDSLSVSARTSATVSVVAGPSVTSFTVSPTSVTSGGSVTFSAVASGGTGPYSWTYSGLPAGCTTKNRSSLTCNPSVTGTFNVRVTVADRFGESANATVALTVTTNSGPTFLGLPQTEGYLVLIVLVIAIAAGLSVWATRRKRRGSLATSSGRKTPPTTPPPDGGE